MPLTGCSRPTVRATGRWRRSGGSVPRRSSRSASAGGIAVRRCSALASADAARSMPPSSTPSATTVACSDGSVRSTPRRAARSAARVRRGKSTRWSARAARSAQHPVAEDEVLRQVDLAEVLPGERPGGLSGLDERVRVGGEGEDGGDPEVGGGLGRGQRPDVGHPQVHEVNRVRRPEDATDAAPRRHPQRPGLGGVHGRTPERHRREVVPGVLKCLQPPQGVHRAATGDGDDPCGRPAPLDERVAELDEEGRDAAVVATTGLRRARRRCRRGGTAARRCGPTTGLTHRLLRADDHPLTWRARRGGRRERRRPAVPRLRRWSGEPGCRRRRRRS